MRRIYWPADLRPMVIESVGGPRSLGQTSALNRFTQTVQTDPGLWEFRFDFKPLLGRAAGLIEGMVIGLEDGANWVGVPCTYPVTPNLSDIGLTSYDGAAWENDEPWGNGQVWSVSKPPAVVAANAAYGARTISIDVSEWGGAIWPGFRIGFFPGPHFGMYAVEEVISIASGDIATVRIWPGLHKAIAANDYVTLDPVVAMRLVPGGGYAGQRVGRFRQGASLQMIQVPAYVIDGLD